jgi:PAS domain S-box-containing protein
MAMVTAEQMNAEGPAAEQFRLLVESVKDYAIFILDPQGNIVSWNEGAQRIKGYSPDEIIGRHFSRFYTPEDLARGKPDEHLRAAASQGRYAAEGWRVRKDGSRFWANVIVTALRNRGGDLVGFAKITRDLTERKQAEEALHELSGRLLAVQDEERKRIGRDLHDGVGQYLMLLKMRLDSLRSAVDSQPGMRRKIDECVHLMEETIHEIRATSYELYPPMLEEVGLKTAIPWYLDGFAERSGIVIPADLSFAPERPPRDTEVAIFRVLQECLTNIRKHSGSTEASVRLHVTDGTATLQVSDRGKGIPPEILDAFNREQLGKLGLGLRGMRERVRQLGGELEVSSSRNGTVVRCSIPYSKSA